MCGTFPWSKRYPDCPPTWLSWEPLSHDPKWDKLWMREDWLSGGRKSSPLNSSDMVTLETRPWDRKREAMWALVCLDNGKEAAYTWVTGGMLLAQKNLSTHWIACLFTYLSFQLVSLAISQKPISTLICYSVAFYSVSSIILGSSFILQTKNAKNLF